MREIKFRVWDGYQNELRPINLIWFEEEQLAAIPDPFGSKYVVMQYTGLKDKQGKDIYEGDIVQNEQPYFKGIVYFERGSFWVREIFSHVDEGIYDGDREKETQWSIDLAYEIIGNIYETPDLVESH